MRRWSVRLMLGLAAICTSRRCRAWGRPRRRHPTRRRAHRTGTRTCRASGRSLNTAAWDIEDHGASLGVPAGHGVVEGGAIPYQPAALAKKKENFEQRATLDPETQVLSARRSPHHLHAVSVSDRSAGRQGLDRLRVCARHSLHLHERESASPGSDRLVDGRLARPLGGEYPRRRCDPFQRPRPGSIAPGISTATPCTSSNATRPRAPITCSMKSRSRTRRCSRGPGR